MWDASKGGASLRVLPFDDDVSALAVRNDTSGLFVASGVSCGGSCAFRAQGQTPLTPACYQGDVAAQGDLLQQGTGVDHEDDDGYTPLFAMSLKGHADAARALLDAGAAIGISGGGCLVAAWDCVRSWARRCVCVIVRASKLLSRKSAETAARASTTSLTTTETGRPASTFVSSGSYYPRRWPSPRRMATRPCSRCSRSTQAPPREPRAHGVEGGRCLWDMQESVGGSACIVKRHLARRAAPASGPRAGPC